MVLSEPHRSFKHGTLKKSSFYTTSTTLPKSSPTSHPPQDHTRPRFWTLFLRLQAICVWIFLIFICGCVLFPQSGHLFWCHLFDGWVAPLESSKSSMYFGLYFHIFSRVSLSTFIWHYYCGKGDNPIYIYCFPWFFLVVLHFKLFYLRLQVQNHRVHHRNYLTESERWLAVYPTSWQHHLHTSGPIRNTSYTWRIIPVTKWLVTPVYNPFRSFGRGTTLLTGLTNRGY